MYVYVYDKIHRDRPSTYNLVQQLNEGRYSTSLLQAFCQFNAIFENNAIFYIKLQ